MIAGRSAEAAADDPYAGFSWACAGIAVVACLAYILALSLAPDALGAPVAVGTRVSLGLVLGLGLAALLVALALIYTYVLNRREAR